MKYITVFKNSCVHIKKNFPTRLTNLNFASLITFRLLQGLDAWERKRASLLLTFCLTKTAELYVTVYRKTGHNAAPFEKNFFCSYRVVGVQILSSPSFIVVA